MAEGGYCEPDLDLEDVYQEFDKVLAFWDDSGLAYETRSSTPIASDDETSVRFEETLENEFVEDSGILLDATNETADNDLHSSRVWVDGPTVEAHRRPPASNQSWQNAIHVAEKLLRQRTAAVEYYTRVAEDARESYERQRKIARFWRRKTQKSAMELHRNEKTVHLYRLSETVAARQLDLLRTAAERHHSGEPSSQPWFDALLYEKSFALESVSMEFGYMMESAVWEPAREDDSTFDEDLKINEEQFSDFRASMDSLSFVPPSASYKSFKESSHMFYSGAPGSAPVTLSTPSSKSAYATPTYFGFEPASTSESEPTTTSGVYHFPTPSGSEHAMPEPFGFDDTRAERVVFEDSWPEPFVFEDSLPEQSGFEDSLPEQFGFEHSTAEPFGYEHGKTEQFGREQPMSEQFRVEIAGPETVRFEVAPPKPPRSKCATAEPSKPEDYAFTVWTQRVQYLDEALAEPGEIPVIRESFDNESLTTESSGARRYSPISPSELFYTTQLILPQGGYYAKPSILPGILPNDGSSVEPLSSPEIPADSQLSVKSSSAGSIPDARSAVEVLSFPEMLPDSHSAGSELLPDNSKESAGAYNQEFGARIYMKELTEPLLKATEEDCDQEKSMNVPVFQKEALVKKASRINKASLTWARETAL